MARPRKEVDWALAERAAKYFCTGEEIAGLLQISYDTLERRCTEVNKVSFADWIKQFHHQARESLRHMQWRMANKGSVAMQIWLGKQYLGQRDRFEHSGDNDNPVSVIVTNIPGMLDAKEG